MKTLSILILALVWLFTSCSTDDHEVQPVNELEDLKKIQEFTNETHIVELYSKTGKLEQGYNNISLRIKEKSSGIYEHHAIISWMPIMHMENMQHSAPFSEVSKVPEKETIYNGFVVFPMAENDSEHWSIGINVSIGDVDFSVNDKVEVDASTNTQVSAFTGADGEKYVLALIEPEEPKLAINDMTVGVFKMENMMKYSVVNGYTVKIDPRMPAMGNHASPNNTDLIQPGTGDFYQGELSLTMTGKWRINLKLLSASGELLKGEEITETVSESSIYFEIEF